LKAESQLKGTDFQKLIDDNLKILQEFAYSVDAYNTRQNSTVGQNSRLVSARPRLERKSQGQHTGRTFGQTDRIKDQSVWQNGQRPTELSRDWSRQWSSRAVVASMEIDVLHRGNWRTARKRYSENFHLLINDC
jgi:hypothetical protein